MNSFFSAIALLFCLCVASLRLGAEDRWIRLVSPNFELLTPAGERDAPRTIRHFEQVREFFEKVLGQQTEVPVRARIILFKNRKQYLPYSWNAVAAAYYTRMTDRDYIVMSTEGDQSTATHEYVHLLARQADLSLPVWLNEGLAELYSTLRPTASTVRVGEPIVGRLLQLRDELLPIRRLLAVDHHSAEYNTEAHAGTFYAQSWALVHMLAVSPKYRPKFGEFFAAVQKGEESAAAIEKTYAISLTDLEEDLTQYARMNGRFNSLAYPIKLDRISLTAEPEACPAGECEAILAQVLANVGRIDEAEAALERAASLGGATAEALGYAYLRLNKTEKAREHLIKAARDTTNPKLLLDAARIALRTGDTAQAENYLTRLMASRPQWQEARLQMMELFVTTRRPEQALALLPRFGPVKRGLATRLFVVSGYAEAMTGTLASARKTEARARQYARTMYEKESVSRLSDFLTRIENANGVPGTTQAIPSQKKFFEEPESEPERPWLIDKYGDDVKVVEMDSGQQMEEAAGTLVQVDCLDKEARLHIQIPGETDRNLVLMIHEPEKVIVRMQPGETTSELQCAEQSRSVKVDYIRKKDDRFQADGIVKILELPKPQL